MIDLPDECYLDFAPDGIGTKTIIIDAVDLHEMAAENLLAMVNGDITRFGGLPLILNNILEVRSLGKTGEPINIACRWLINGLARLAARERIVLFRGETAESGHCVGTQNENALAPFNWCSVATGVLHPDKLIMGDSFAPGQVLLALKEDGFGSNGFSAIRRTALDVYGSDYFQNSECQRLLRAAAEPAALYDLFLTHLNGWWADDFKPEIPVHLIAHITGGGIDGKFCQDRLFPCGLSATLDDLFNPCDAMKWVVEQSGMSDEESYQTFNGGQRLIAAIDAENVATFISRASDFGLWARVCGHVLEPGPEGPSCIVTSKYNGRVFQYLPEAATVA